MTVKDWAETRAAAEALVSLLQKNNANTTIIDSAVQVLEMVKFEEKNARAWEAEGRIPYYGG